MACVASHETERTDDGHRQDQRQRSTVDDDRRQRMGIFYTYSNTYKSSVDDDRRQRMGIFYSYSNTYKSSVDDGHDEDRRQSRRWPSSTEGYIISIQ